MSYQSSIIKNYELDGWIVVKAVKMSKNGYPDLYLYKEGKTLWIECKEKNDTLKPIQKYVINQLNKQGISAICLQDGKGIIHGKIITNG